MREALYLRNPACTFPWSVNLGRRKDSDHTVPYVDPDDGGTPGQTALDNLALMTRSAHRLKTHGRWRLKHPEPGMFLWRSPHGWIFLVNNTGTHHLGDNPTARAFWDRAAAIRSDVIPAGEVVLEYEPHHQAA